MNFIEVYSCWDGKVWRILTAENVNNIIKHSLYEKTLKNLKKHGILEFVN